jgi:hypothetical protein
MVTYDTYTIIGGITIIASFFGILFYYKNKKKKKIYYSIIDTPHPDILVNDIINSFYYAHMYAKNIKFFLFKHEISITLDQQYIKMKSIVNGSLIKFLISTSYHYFIFFVTQEGILEIVYFDNKIIHYTDDSSILLIIDHSIENNLFDIKQDSIVLKNNNTQKTIHIIKEFLRNNTR